MGLTSLGLEAAAGSFWLGPTVEAVPASLKFCDIRARKTGKKHAGPHLTTLKYL